VPQSRPVDLFGIKQAAEHRFHEVATPTVDATFLKVSEMRHIRTPAK